MERDISNIVKGLFVTVLVCAIAYLVIFGTGAYRIFNAEDEIIEVTVLDKETVKRSGSTHFINGMAFRSGGGTSYRVLVTDGSTEFYISTTKTLYDQAIISNHYTAKVGRYKGMIVTSSFLTKTIDDTETEVTE